MKRLIVTADDVGLHRGITDGAIRCHREGVVTACSIVANGAAFEHAVERLQDFPDLAAGVHLTLVEERPMRDDVPSLIAGNGLFHENYIAFVPRYLAGRISIDEVEAEFRAQIEAVLSAGITIRHLNGHQHLHLLPKIFDVVEKLAEEYGIGYVRIVDEAVRAASAMRQWSIAVLSHYGRGARERARIGTNDRTIGVAAAGHLTSVDALLAMLDEVHGTTELVCHPGVDRASLAESYEWGYEWDAETGVLCDSRVRSAIVEREIELIAP